MSFKYPEIKTDGTGDATIRSSNGWDAKCSSFELLDDNIKYGKRKKPQQSPININTKTVQECSTLCNLEINYKPGKCRIDKYEDNLIRMVHDEGSYIKFGENNYELKYIFFHTPGNHLIDGKNSHMEINFYHGIMEDLDIERVEESRQIKIKNKHNHKHYHAHTDGLEDNNLNGRKNGVVLSVMVDVSQTDDNETRATKPNIFLSQFIHTDAFRDLKPNEDPIVIDVGKKWSVEQLLPEKKAFYTYNGSIAMPPCTENYAWVVFDQHISIISEYLKMFRIIGNPKGNREAHPLNDRMVFFNPNVKVVEKEMETEDKNTFVEKQLAPIRIMYDNRAGSEYRVRADYVINKYMNGDNVGWQNDDSKLKSIATDWEETSKIGYQEVQVKDLEYENSIQDYKDRTEPKNPKLTDFVLDFYVYNSMDYLDYYKNINSITFTPTFNVYQKKVINLLNSGGNIFKNLYQYMTHDGTGNPDLTEDDDGFIPIPIEYQDDLNILFDNFNGGKNADRSNKVYRYLYDNNRSFFESNDQNGDPARETGGRPNNKLVIDDVTGVCQQFTDGATLGGNYYKYLLLYVLYCWNQSENGGGITQVMEILDNNINDTFQSLREKIMYNLLKDFSVPEETKPLIFRIKKAELNTTLDGDTCQNWGSNQVHYEGNILEFWKSPLKISKDGYTFGDMSYELKEAAKDGLLIPVGGRYMPHNNCRNPNNAEGAPWCYTTNKKVRWQYCAIPDSSTKNRYYILILVFLMILILAILLVKLIFRFEYFSEIVAKITGGKITSETVTGSVPEVPASTGTTMASAATTAARMI